MHDCVAFTAHMLSSVEWRLSKPLYWSVVQTLRMTSAESFIDAESENSPPASNPKRSSRISALGYTGTADDVRVAAVTTTTVTRNTTQAVDVQHVAARRPLNCRLCSARIGSPRRDYGPCCSDGARSSLDSGRPGATAVE